MELKTKKGATLVAPIEIGKKIHNHQSGNVLNSTFAKESNFCRPKFDWFTMQLKKKQVLYINQTKSAEWLESYRNQSSADIAQLRGALSSYIIADTKEDVKTEKDLARFYAQLAHVQNSPAEKEKRVLRQQEKETERKANGPAKPLFRMQTAEQIALQGLRVAARKAIRMGASYQEAYQGILQATRQELMRLNGVYAQ